MAKEEALPYWDLSATTALWLGAASYAALLLLLLVQTRLLPLRHALLRILAQSEILLFLIMFLYFLAGLRIFPELATVDAGVILLLYACALAVFYYAAYQRMSAQATVSRGSFVEGQLRLTLPFAAPYLLLAILADLLAPWVVLDPGTPATMWFTSVFLAGFMLLLMAFMPPFVVRAWKCRPIVAGTTRQALEELCRKAGFRYRAILSWTILDHVATAAILGVFSTYRYVMFTELMLCELSPRALQAVLAHEIGHSRHHHLLLYPFILFGGLVLAGLSGYLATPALVHWLALVNRPSLLPLASLLPYGMIIALYFRFVFGFFSRLFERQADLSVFSLGVHPQQMVEALHTVAVLGGHSHDQPSWHHFSISQRIVALQEAEQHPEMVQLHTKRVRRAVLLYAAFLALGLIVLLALSFSEANGVNLN